MKDSFGILPSGQEATLYTISGGGVTACITDYGATLVNVLLPDGNGGTLKVRDFNPLADKLNVYVLTQAVQSQGFSDPVSALNAAFGTDIPALGN